MTPDFRVRIPITSYLTRSVNAYGTLAAVVFLAISYFAFGIPPWISAAKPTSLPVVGNIDHTSILFLLEFVVWCLLLCCQLLIYIFLLERNDTNERKQSANIITIATVESAVFIGVITYHVVRAYAERVFWPRLFYSIFSWIVVRQILIIAIILFVEIRSRLQYSIKTMKSDPRTALSQARWTTADFAYSMAILLLLVLALVVWSPTLLPVGGGPKSLSIAASILVTLASLVSVLYVQRKMRLAAEQCVIPLEGALAGLWASTYDADELDRATKMLSLRDDFIKAFQLPVIAILLSLLQLGTAAVGAFTAIGGLSP